MILCVVYVYAHTIGTVDIWCSKLFQGPSMPTLWVTQGELQPCLLVLKCVYLWCWESRIITSLATFHPQVISDSETQSNKIKAIKCIWLIVCSLLQIHCKNVMTHYLLPRTLTILLNALAIQLNGSYLITMTADAHEKVIWFDISVDEVLCVYIFNPADHLKRGKRSIIKYLRKLSNTWFIKDTHLTFQKLDLFA